MVRRPLYSVTVGVAVAAALGVWCQRPGTAHTVFKKSMEEKYENLTVTCNSCHVKGEAKTERTEFGQLFAKELDGQDLTKKWQELESDKDAREKFEVETMHPAFLEALKKVAEKPAESGEKYGDLIAGGKIDGTKLKKK